MDPVTHGVIGLALSSFSGVDVSSNPVSLGCMVGAMAPDIDVVVKVFKGDKEYLKHHRGITHSIPFLALLSLGISLPLYFLFGGEFSFLSIMIWTFIGACSHTFFDILNSYGAMLFKQKKKISLLMLYDPVVILVSGYMIFRGHLNFFDYPIVIGGFAVYLYMRYLMKKNAFNNVMAKYDNVEEIELIPSLVNFFSWRYIISTDKMNISGEYDVFTGKYKKINEFEKEEESLEELFKETDIGKYFLEFTPNIHVEKIDKGDYYILKATDLRYFYRNKFMHHATVHLSNDNTYLKSFIHPYNFEKEILFSMGS